MHNSRLEATLKLSSKTIITLAMGRQRRYYLTFNLIKLSEWQAFNAQRAVTQVRQCLDDRNRNADIHDPPLGLNG